MNEVFIDKFKGFLTFIIPCMGFILSQKFEDELTSESKFGYESANIL